MPLDPSLAGRAFAPTAPYTVSREKIAEFTTAIGADPIDGGETAPLTFPIVIAFGAMTQLMTDPDVGIELHNVVHGDQRFEQQRPIRAGDRLSCVVTIDGIREMGGSEILTTRADVHAADGEPVVTAWCSLVIRAQPAGPPDGVGGYRRRDLLSGGGKE